MFSCKKDNNTKFIELGQHLFYEQRLSVNGTKSCGSCHNPAFAFSDGYTKSVTVYGESTLHNAPSLINSSFMKILNWSKPNIHSLEHQMLRPLFSETPTELGVNKNRQNIISLFKTDKYYSKTVSKLFPEFEKNIDSVIIRSIAAFVRTLKSQNSPYDKFTAGDSDALSVSAKRGLKLFFSDSLTCKTCHQPPFFTKANFTNAAYENIGLYNVANKNTYLNSDIGLGAQTHKTSDNGKFRIPSLRNVWLTAPYMHDGSINSLEEVIKIYENGGKEIETGPLKGDGRKNIYKNNLIKGFKLNDNQRKDLLNFLVSLTDSTVLNNPKFQNPLKSYL